jgi:hypothetical protein
MQERSEEKQAISIDKKHKTINSAKWICYCSHRYKPTTTIIHTLDKQVNYGQTQYSYAHCILKKLLPQINATFFNICPCKIIRNAVEGK